MATPVVVDTDMVGVIDNPNDIDYYEISVTSPTMMKCSISSSKGYSLSYGGGKW